MTKAIPQGIFHSSIFYTLFIILFSSFLSSSGTFLLFAGGKPDRAEVKDIIQKEAPYIKDQQYIRETLSQIKDRQNENTKNLTVLLADVGDIKGYLRGLKDKNLTIAQKD